MTREGVTMTKLLSKSEIDKLLGRDNMKRCATSEEIRVLKEAIENKTRELGKNKNEKLPKEELKK